MQLDRRQQWPSIEAWNAYAIANRKKAVTFAAEDWGAWNAYLETKYREPRVTEGAHFAIQDRRRARGEDPETGLPVPELSDKARKRGTHLGVLIAMAVAILIAWFT